MPPRELAELLAVTAAEQGGDDPEQLYRAALNRLGLRRLTTNFANRLTAVAQLTDPS